MLATEDAAVSAKTDPTRTLLSVTTLAFALLSGHAAASDTREPASQLRITEVSEYSHPFDTLYCARLPVQVRFMGRLAEVVARDESRTLVQAISASGSRYVAPGDDTTELWAKGSMATLTWSGQQLPVCAPSGAIIPPYRASGNEPFWSVSYDGWSSVLSRPGETDVVRDAVISESSTQGQTLSAGNDSNGWRLQAHDGLCIDDMSGMPHPQHATLHYESNTLQGCGGDPERLLQGVVWNITQIGDRSVIDQSNADIQFHANGEITGSSGCNRFFGRYTLTGESLSFENVGSTRRACPTEHMAQEKALFAAMASVQRFSFEDSESQRLILHTDNIDIRLQIETM